MFKNIMVVFDDTKLAPKALTTAINLTQHYEGATMHICHVNVISGDMKVHATDSDPLTEVLADSGRRVMNMALDIVKDYEVNYEPHIIEGGTVVQPLLKFARDNKIDIIVVASRGLGLVRQAMGSVSHHLAEESPVPVLIVKE